MTSEQMSPACPPRQVPPDSPVPIHPVMTRFPQYPPGSPAGSPTNVPQGPYGPGGTGHPEQMQTAANLRLIADDANPSLLSDLSRAMEALS